MSCEECKTNEKNCLIKGVEIYEIWSYLTFDHEMIMECDLYLIYLIDCVVYGDVFCTSLK
jgi:hypothetical protein